MILQTIQISLMAAMACSIALAVTNPKPSSYGTGIKGEVTHSISQIQKNKDELRGKYVRIKGKVTDVCPMKGCWMELEDVATGARIKIKVKDDVIVFPETAKGKTSTVEGRLVARHMNQRKATQYMRHLAEEKGEKFDPASVTGPMTIYELDAKGAQIEP